MMYRGKQGAAQHQHFLDAVNQPHTPDLLLPMLQNTRLLPLILLRKWEEAKASLAAWLHVASPNGEEAVSVQGAAAGWWCVETCNSTGTQSALSGNTTTAMAWLRRLAPQGPLRCSLPFYDTGAQDRLAVSPPLTLLML